MRRYNELDNAKSRKNVPWGAWVIPVVGIDPNETGFDIGSDTMRSGEIGGPYSRT